MKVNARMKNQQAEPKVANDSSFDLSIFDKDWKGVKYSQCSSDEFLNCASIPRLIQALAYYAKLDVIGNEGDRNDFVRFVTEIYPELLNDFTHLVSQHNHSLQQIKEHFLEDTACKIATCEHSSRHYRQEKKKQVDYSVKHKLDPELVFFIDLMDSLHFYLFHCIESGFRDIKTSDSESIFEL